MNITTPKKITDTILAVCKQVQPASEPIYLPVRPAAGEPLAACVHVVERKIARDRGKAQLGWIIWEFPFTWLDFEFHSVWVSPSGEVVDVSRKPDGEKRILFLPDSSLNYEGQRIHNITLPLRQHAVIAEALLLVEAQRKLVPAPGQKIDIDLGHPLIAIEKRLKVLKGDLERMALARIRSRK